jgi:hypothetical protein
MNEWSKTQNNKKMKVIAGGGIVVVAPTDTSNVVPLFCPCCELPMKTSDDGLAYRKVGVCHKCDERWTNKPNVVWPEGPDKTSDDWKEYVKIRSLLEKPTLDFK